MHDRPARLAVANQVYLRRASKLVLPGVAVDAAPGGQAYVATMAKNIEAYGYMFSRELFDSLVKLDLGSLTSVYRMLLDHLRRELKTSEDLKPFYAGFPEQVMKASDAELYHNAILHYLTDGYHSPPPPQAPKKLFGLFQVPTLPVPAHLTIERRPFRILDVTTDELDDLLRNLLSSNVALSSEDRYDFDLVMSIVGDEVAALIPQVVTNRENAATILAALYKHSTLGDAHAEALCNTATDVLRLATAFSGGDVSLAAPTRYKLKRWQRRLLMRLLDRTLRDNKQGITDMLRHKIRWIRLGEVLHPGEFKKHEAVKAAYDVLRNDISYASPYSALEAALEAADVSAAIAQLHWRPGDFARRLDHLLRVGQRCEDADGQKIKILEAFKAVAPKVSTIVLLQMLPHFEKRDKKHAIRVFYPKGAVAKAQCVEDELPLLSTTTCADVLEICKAALVERFAKLPPLGDCYLEPGLKDFAVPFVRRSASKAMHSVARGTRLPLPDGEILRFFLFWKNGLYRTDLDLTAVLFDSSYNSVLTLSYYNLRSFGGVHSGDIVDAPEGASEFIDIPYKKARELGGRFIVVLVNSYTLQPYCDLPECFTGWMARNERDGGAVFEPRTVEQRVDIASDTKIAIPAIFDLEEKCVIWADLALSNMPGFNNNAAVNKFGIQLALQSVVEDKRLSLYDLMALHVAARGKFVPDKSQARTVFDTDSFAFDLTRITSEFM